MKYSKFVKPNKKSIFKPKKSYLFYYKVLKNFLNRYKYKLIFLILILISLLLINFFKIFNIKKDNVTVLGVGLIIEEHNFKKYIQEQVENKNLITLNINNLKNELLKTFPNLKDIHIKKLPLNKIEFLCIERKPIFAVYSQSLDHSLMVAEDGYVLGNALKEYDFLFKVRYDGSVKQGDFIDQNIFTLYNEIIKQTDKVNLNLSQITFSNGYSIVQLDNGVNVYLSNYKSIQDSLIIVSFILNNNKYAIMDSKNKDSKDFDYLLLNKTLQQNDPKINNISTTNNNQNILQLSETNNTNSQNALDIMYLDQQNLNIENIDFINNLDVNNTIDGKKILQTIDLRFNKVVVSYL